MTADQPRQEILDLVERHGHQLASTASFRPGVTAIPAAGKVIGASELRQMVDAVLDGWLTSGRFNHEFERRLGRFLDVEHVLTTNSGSSANLLAFSALTSPSLGARAIKAGDEVITVAAGFPTTINPILQNGCVPVFVDIALPTYNIDAPQIETAISSRTRAIMLAHTLGNPFDLDEVCRIAKKYDLWLIEDCCDALGSTYKGRGVGSFGDIGTLSFYPAHHITMGEGGAVFTQDAQLRRIIESIRDWGRDCYCATGCDNTCGKRFEQQHGELPFGYDHKYTYSQLGYNLKITDIQAACALAQMDRLPDFIATRKRNFAYLTQRLAPLAEFLLLPQATPGSDPSWFGFPLTLKPT
ncbi:MAG TPA: lipopolysaccharide biosynthesis protein RfbH, partial [Accumulibacter sp.]|uniref:lipopolysaccharide biosynthesis protein RfbH n=1 Tax=Accumulibacter sp. TaxID=2053492 RepID=UPI002CCD091A